MLNISEQFANAGKQTFQSQIALLQKFSQKAFESSQKIIALNISTGKTLLGDHHEIAEHWIHSKHPFEFWVKDPQEMQPGLHHLFHYERELSHILSNAQAELLTFAFSEVAEIQNELADLGSHLHEHNKAKQDVVKQAAHAYSAEIKSLYPQPRASSSKTKDAAKPAEAIRPAAKNIAKPAAKAVAKATATSTKKPAAKPAISPAITARPVSKEDSKAAKKGGAEKPAAKAHVASKQAVKTPAAKVEAKAGIVAPASPNAGKAASKAPARVATKPAEKPVAKSALKAELKAPPAMAEVVPALHHTAEESHRPPMPRPAVQHKLEVHAEAPSVLNLDDQVVE